MEKLEMRGNEKGKMKSIKRKKQKKKITTSAAGFEPTRAEPSRFLVYRLNHSAKRTVEQHCYQRCIVYGVF